MNQDLFESKFEEFNKCRQTCILPAFTQLLRLVKTTNSAAPNFDEQSATYFYNFAARYYVLLIRKVDNTFHNEHLTTEQQQYVSNYHKSIRQWAKKDKAFYDGIVNSMKPAFENPPLPQFSIDMELETLPIYDTFADIEIQPALNGEEQMTDEQFSAELDSFQM